MPKRDLLFSVRISDCIVQHFRSGGPGGQHQNKTESGTRIIHEPSGARGESREERSQLANKKLAFRRMVHHPRFRFWVAQEVRRLTGETTAEQRVEQMMADPTQFRVEVKDGDGRWVEAEPTEKEPVIRTHADAVHIHSGRNRHR